MKTVCIVQARMGSSRLPNKVMLDVAGQTVLRHVLDRCHAIDGVDEVCVATTDNWEDDAIVGETHNAGATVFRGSESDVLDRYLRAALESAAVRVLRVTADCLMLDPGVCAQVLRHQEQTGADFATNNAPPSWPHGLDCEVVTLDWLERAHGEAVDRFDREHVMPWIRRHDAVRLVNVAAAETLSMHRWILDTPEDLVFLRDLMPKLGDGPEGWRYQTVLSLLRQDEDLWRESVSKTRAGAVPDSRATSAAKSRSTGPDKGA